MPTSDGKYMDLSKLGSYSEYKDSGVEWIGEIPEHWDVVKINHITQNHDGKRIPLSSDDRGKIQGDIAYYGANGIIDYINDYIFNGEYILIGEDGLHFSLITKM